MLWLIAHTDFKSEALDIQNLKMALMLWQLIFYLSCFKRENKTDKTLSGPNRERKPFRQLLATTTTATATITFPITTFSDLQLNAIVNYFK